MADVFDYIIVGGGIAGPTIAARLTESSNTTVLVLEAGADHTSDLNVLAPSLSPAMYGNPEYDRDWDYKTVAQLGGSSAMNLMFWTHPSRQDIDSWGELGNAGWSWEELAPYLRNLEAFVAPSEQQTADMLLDYVDQDSHGTGGPIVNDFPQLQSPLLRTWPRTLENLGLAVRSDPRDVKALGGYVNLLNIDGATRSFAANAYLGPARCPNT
ncbi:hypothetical protein COL154_006068 [Colletotrichum chrysophilum]|nr:hypothetical protein KNSL1_007432 [Colletotrichum chrysophilum]KAJ0362623.1 hypothetical protein COL154_006068 [Colletotrichum chrysophilum]